MNVGDKVLKEMIKHGNISRFCLNNKLPTSTVNNFIYKNADVRLSTFLKICDALDKTPDYFLREK